MPERAPDMEGPLAKAWRFQGESGKPDHRGHISQWVVTGIKHETTPDDWAGPFHIAWNWWMVGCVHLRPIEGVKEPHKQYPEAEYEFLILSIDPEMGEPDPDTPGSLHFLTPADVVKQFHGIDDVQAAEVVEAAVKAICQGMLSPDQDFRAAWGRAIDATVDHYARGIH